ncbi:transcription elongation factor A N-terminal and central domain-containing protein 2-like isoform X1 [Mizuhopecten yessoensis]|uniref:transcription elongation factor A N-terminal and central domain-containing protein 2-like isoform X1 n=1 Tax=Mizuhopecten yessoensis TaxID=6573 RepID=UPI000B45A5BC|nr:transcription elongation factor A N-terminal and central domain-containing protein 2-like isoform X1 [Mizuhopecten yessoensis]
MDKFVTKKPREAQGIVKKAPKTYYKQSTIESLKGVVVIEDIHRIQAKLRLNSTTQEEMVECLRELGKKIPPRNVMKDTKIGKVVNKLRQHEDSVIRKEAKKVYIKWKSHFENLQDRQQIEVKCDARTERLRSSGQRLLSESLGVKEDNTLPEVIERDTFHLFKRMVNNNYRRTIRNMVFTLKHQEDVRTQVLSGQLSVEKLIQTCKR